MLPFHLGCTDFSSLLFELSDGRFQFISDSVVAPLMTGHQYVLVENNLAKFLEELELDQVSFRPAVIWNRRLDEELHTHKRLVAGKTFFSDQISELDLTGKQLYLMQDEYIFVSPELKDVLEAQGFERLHFSEGMSEFVGEAT